jgi:hypothetical protein
VNRLVLILAAALLGAVVLGVLWLGLLPPEPPPQRIERPVPIDRAAPPAGVPPPAAPAR